MEVLRNAWYVAAWGDEIGAHTLLGRTILGKQVLLFRDRSGTLAAIGDRCPHRFAPLHRGRHVGDAVQCGYHGLEFGSNGLCSRNPHDSGNVPPNAMVPSYPVVERYGAVWIWMGDREADESKIPADFSFMSDENRGRVKGHMHADANYLLLVDNLMDLSHALYLHAGALTSEEMRENFVPQARLDGDVVVCEREQPGIAPPGQWVDALPPDVKKVDFFSHVYWHAPSAVIHPFGCKMPGKPEGVDGGVSSCSGHFFTPETESTTHYFYQNTRDYKVDSTEMDDQIRALLERVFGEQDIPMIEAQQKIIGNVDLMTLRPLVLPTDRATVLVRRHLAKLIRQDQSDGVASESALVGATDRRSG
jgi:phenylpropionate dioxygenase-like ring-hydroxylating dioxygenase large terminal subunit